MTMNKTKKSSYSKFMCVYHKEKVETCHLFSGLSQVTNVWTGRDYNSTSVQTDVAVSLLGWLHNPYPIFISLYNKCGSGTGGTRANFGPTLDPI